MISVSKAKSTKEFKVNGSAKELIEIADQLCKIFVDYKLDGKWNELLDVHETQENTENWNDIIRMCASQQEVDSLSFWHLEKVAMGELEAGRDTYTEGVNLFQKELRKIKSLIQTILNRGEEADAKRKQHEEAMKVQREIVLRELQAAQVFQRHIYQKNDMQLDREQMTPISVKQRLLSAIETSQK